jgi:hypothetical protein
MFYVLYPFVTYLRTLRRIINSKGLAERVAITALLLAPVQNVFVSNLNPDIGYLDWGFLGVFLSLSGEVSVIVPR